VGYPAALRESDRVALGTDGHRSDMAEEAAALRAIAAEAGDDPAAADRRLAAGEALAAELFGPDASRDAVVIAPGEDGARVQSVVIAGEEVVSGGRLARADLEAIRAEAEEAAARLWQRMSAIREQP
jgi:hypothetical protein